MFVTTFPCIECAKMIVQSGIKKIVYSNAEGNVCQKINDQEKQASKRLFDLSNIAYVLLR